MLRRARVGWTATASLPPCLTLCGASAHHTQRGSHKAKTLLSSQSHIRHGHQQKWQKSGRISLGRETRQTHFNFLFQIDFTWWGPGTGWSGWGPPGVPTSERKTRAELCGDSFPCGFGDKWSSNSDTPEDNLRNHSEPQSKPASHVPPICLRTGRINCWTRDVHKHIKQPTPNLSLHLGSAKKQRLQFSDVLWRHGQGAPWKAACHRDKASLPPVGWHRASTLETISPFEADSFAKPLQKLFSKEMRVPYI